MRFFLGVELWSNIIGGVVAAALIAIFARLWEIRKHKILKDLTEIMGQAIKHRNIGEHCTFADENEWVRQAKKIEVNAVAKAKQLSTTAGSLIEWLDRVPPWNEANELEKYVSILSTVIKRIRGFMERNA